MKDTLRESSSTPENWADHRYWQQLLMTTRMWARVLWVHVREREGELGKDDLIVKLLLRVQDIPSKM